MITIQVEIGNKTFMMTTDKSEYIKFKNGVFCKIDKDGKETKHCPCGKQIEEKYTICYYCLCSKLDRMV